MRRLPGPSLQGRAAVLVPLFLAACAGATPALAASWSQDDVRLSSPQLQALTAPSRTTLVRLPGDRLYAVWYERVTLTTSVIRGAERDAQGAWVTDPVALSLGDSLVKNPVLAAGPGGDLHVAWEDLRAGDAEIFYRHRRADGEWEPEVRVTFGNPPSENPALAVSTSGRVHLAWSDAEPGNLELFIRHRDPDGEFSTPRRLTFDPAGSREANLAVDAAGDVHLVWQDGVLDESVPGEALNTEIYYMSLNAEDEPWTAPIRVSRALGTSQTPTMAFGADGAMHVFWADNRDVSPANGQIFPFAIWYRRWLPGLGFGHEKRFCYSTVDHLNPSAATTDDGTISVVWEDYSHGNAEVYFRQIRLSTGWDVDKTRLTFTPGPTRAPMLLSEPDGPLHLVWSDASPGEETSIRYRPGRADDTVPVRMAGSRLVRDGERLRLQWQTTAEWEHAGFRIFGALDAESESWPVTGLVGGGPDYSVTLDRAELGEARLLRLVAIARSGATETVALFPLDEAAAPGVVSPSLVLGAPFPNPAPGAFTVPLRLAAPAPVRLDLFDLQGRRVAGRDLGLLAAGEHQVGWTLGAGDGAAPAAGRYWLRVTAPGVDRSPVRPILVVP